MENRVIVTGGRYTLDMVSVYTEQGWAGDLPRLNTGRWTHACGHYVNAEDQVVSTINMTL